MWKDLFVQFFNKGWTILLSFLATPFYIARLGVEAYGLIGFYHASVALFSIAYLGISDTYCRALVSMSQQREERTQLSHLSRSIEISYWLLGLLMSAALYCLSPAMAKGWFQEHTHYSHSDLCLLLRLMSLAFLLQWGFLFYCKILISLEKHRTHTGLLCLGGTLTHLTSVSCLFLTSSPSLHLFCWCQIAVSLLQAAAAAYLVRREWNRYGLFSEKTAWLQLSHSLFAHLRSQWRFNCGLMGFSVLFFLLLQTDKLLLSRWLSLKEFGQYCLAYTAVSALGACMQPILTVYYPKFIRYAEEKRSDISSLYHTSSQTVILLLAPFTALAVFFSPSILSLWLRDADLVSSCSLLVSVFALGGYFSCLIQMPTLLQIAFRSTKLLIIYNGLSLGLLIPCLYFMSLWQGALGGSLFYLFLNLSYLFFLVPLLHRRLLPQEMGRWYQESLLPLSSALLSAFLLSLFQPFCHSYGMLFLLLLFSLLVTFSSVAMTLYYLRKKQIRICPPLLVPVSPPSSPPTDAPLS